MTSDAILASAAAIATEWRWLAIVWHALFALLLAAIFALRFREQRAIAVMTALPVASVAALAWWNGNPFNGTLFAVTAMALFAVASALPSRPIALGSPWAVGAGACCCALAWGYPHFLSGPWTQYLYAAPLGLLPCPTLALCIGVSLITRGFGSMRWAVLVFSMALTYGVIGVFTLGVSIDWALIIGAVMLASSTWPVQQHTNRFFIHVRRTI